MACMHGCFNVSLSEAQNTNQRTADVSQQLQSFHRTAIATPCILIAHLQRGRLVVARRLSRTLVMQYPVVGFLRGVSTREKNHLQINPPMQI